MMKIGFVGAGKMAQALASGIAKTLFEPAIFFSDPSDDASEQFCELVPSAERVKWTRQVFESSEIVFLAIKPQVARTALADIADLHLQSTLSVSIVGGIRLEDLYEMLGYRRVIRVMPNTPCLIGKGMSAISPGADVPQEDVERTTKLMESVGDVVAVEERLLDAVTGVSGSGPAYVYTMIEAMIDAGVLHGLHRSVARQLAIETVIGAAEMVKRTGSHPSQLRDQVTSPGGTTIAGMHQLDAGGFRATISRCISATVKRSIELGD